MSALLGILAAPLVLAVGAAGSPAKAQSVFCGETITQSVKLTADLDCPSGVGLVAGVAHITIDLGGHTITGNTSSAGIVDSGHGQITVKNGSIAGFFIDVALSNAPGSTVTGVVARGALQGGIEIGTSDATTITKVTVVGNGSYGVYLDSDGTTLSGSLVSATFNGPGVDVLGDADVVSKNTISASHAQAILLTSAGDQVTKNVIRGSANGQAAIELDGAQGSTVSGNTVTGAANDGILVSGSDGATITKNTVTGSGDEGIVVDSVSLGSLVVGNTADQNAEGGIEVLNANSTEKIGKNTADANGFRGIAALVGVTDLGGNSAKENGVLNCDGGGVTCS